MLIYVNIYVVNIYTNKYNKINKNQERNVTEKSRRRKITNVIKTFLFAFV